MNGMDMDNEELDPRIVAAMRDIPPAGDDVREVHIATALGAAGGSSTVGHARTDRRGRWLSAAAAAVVLLAVGTAFGRSTVRPSPTEPAPGAPTTTVPPKTGAGKCEFTAGTLGDVGWVSEADISGVRYLFLSRDRAIDILRDDSSCTRVTSIVEGGPSQ